MQNNKKAVLISTNSDIDFIKNKFSNNAETDFIASEYPIIQLNKSVKLKYLFEFINKDLDLYNFVSDITLNWNKDKNGLDNISKNNIDIGLLLKWRLTVLLTSYIKIYFSFQELSMTYDVINISDKLI